MTKRKVWRYTCEFCRKSGCSGGAIGKHEKGCTANPNRVCGLCVRSKHEQVKTNSLVWQFSTYSPTEALANLREITFNCPACMLTAIRISKVCKWDGDPTDPPPELSFNFKTEIAEWWTRQNEAEAEEESRYSYY